MLDSLQLAEEKLFKLYSQTAPTCPLASLRKRAWDQFSQLGLPTKKSEAFQYVPLRKVLAKDLERGESEKITKKSLLPFLLPECQHSHLVFVNGFFSKELSDITHYEDKTSLFFLADAMNSYGIFMQNRFAKDLKEEKDPFSFLNFALHSDGAFLHIFPQKVLGAPLQILQVITEGRGTSLLSPRLHVVLSKGSEASFVSTMVNFDTSKSYWMNQGIDIAIEENAKAKWLDYASLSETAWHFTSFRSTLKKNATLDAFAFTNGSESSRGSYRISLLEEGSSACIRGLSLLHSEREAHIHVLLEHNAPSAHSRQHFKSVLQDESKSSFEGKIKVEPIAQKTMAYQLSNHLLLSDTAIAYAKPNLEIFADDVKASHGATFAQLGKEELFYLQTRGLSYRDAKRLLTLGFCQELLEEVWLNSIKEKISGSINEYFQRGL